MIKSIIVNSSELKVEVCIESFLKASAVSNFIEHMDDIVYLDEPGFHLTTEELKFFCSGGAKLEKLVDDLSLGEKVTFFGDYDVPEKLMSSVTLFVSTSNYEGFGLAAFESYVCGHSVVVNSVFPTELLDVCPDIIKIENINSQIIKGLLKSDTFDH